MNRISTFLALVCLMVTGAWAQAPANTQKAAAEEVISDFMGENPGLTVNVTIDPNFKDNGKDKFTYTLSGSTLNITASNGVSACRGFYDFTKSNGAGICSWSANRFKAPASPTTTTKTVTSPYRDHQYLNVVTYGYSMPYWDENRWDKEIAWMALHGIDMPLMLVGSETIYRDVFKALYGTSNTELDAWEVGPAHLPWMRMGNLAGNSFDGPLGDHWHSKQKALAKHILQKMGALGMKPVVPAFGGFVPPAVAQQLGNASTTGWNWVPDNYKNYRLTPTAGTGGQDGEFKKIGKKFIELWDKEYESSYGSQFKYYLSDSFNEMDVPSDPATLQTYGEQIYGAIKEGSGNNDAVWVTQGWEFVYGSGKWTNGSTSDAKYKALTAGVPQGKFMSLYMSPEYGNGKWSSYDNFDGDDWVYTMLPNMGGKNFWTGPLQNYATTWPKSMANSGAYSNCTGWGMTMEGIEYNEMLYELIADMGWTDPSTGKNLDNWVTEYGNARYGSDKYSDKFKALHTTMRNTVYSSYIDHVNFGWQGNGKSGGYYNAGNIGTANDTFFEGFEAFFGDENMGELQAIAENGGLDETMRADLIEFSAFYAAARVEKICKRITTANNTGNKTLANELIAELDKVMTDMDYILTGHPIYDEAKWEAKARTLAGSDVDTQKKYVKNARRIVTTWYGNHQGHEAVNDYASRIYAGIIRDYYLPRLKAELNQLVNGTACNLRDIERSFTPNGDVATDAPELSDPGYYLGSDEKTTVPGGITSSTSDAVLLANIQALVEEAQEAGQIIIEKNQVKYSTDAESFWYIINSNNATGKLTDRALTISGSTNYKGTVQANTIEATNEQIWRFIKTGENTCRMENRNGQTVTWDNGAIKTYLANIGSDITLDLDQENTRYTISPEGIETGKGLSLTSGNTPTAGNCKNGNAYVEASTWTLSEANGYIGVPLDEDFNRITRRFEGFKADVWGSTNLYGKLGQPNDASALQAAINAVATRDLALATYTDYLATYNTALETNFRVPTETEARKLFDLIISAFQINPAVNGDAEAHETFRQALIAAQTTLAKEGLTSSEAVSATATLEAAVKDYLDNAASFPYTSKAPVNGVFNEDSKVITMKMNRGGYITTASTDDSGNLTLTGINTEPTDKAGYWIVSGNDTQGYTFYNVAAGATKILAMTGQNDNARIALCSTKNVPQGATTAFKYGTNEIGGGVFYISGNNAWNNRSSNGKNYLALWNDANVFKQDTGSSLTFHVVTCEDLTPTEAANDWEWEACNSQQTTNFKASAYYDVKQITIGSASTRRQVRAKAAEQGTNTVTVTVEYKGGSHAQAIYGVQLLDTDGAEVANSGYTEGIVGGSPNNIKTYTLNNVPDGSYTVRVWGAATKGNETMTANGTVEVTVNGTKDGNTQNWNKNNWYIENTAVPAGVKALAPNVGITLNTGGAAQTYYYLDKPMTFKEAGPLSVTINNKATEDIGVIGVELLKNGSTLVETAGTYDGHYSDGKTNNTYTVQVPEAGNYTVRTWASYVPAKAPANGEAIYGGGEEEEILLRPTFVSSSDTRTTNGEYASKLVDDIDNPTSTKWGMGYTAGTPAWIVVQANNTVLKGYDLYNANDTNGNPGRRWKNWTVEGSNDGETWAPLDEVTNANMDATNFGKNSYSTESNAQQYNYYKFTITANEGGGMIQMSDLQLKVVYKGEKTSYLVTSDGVPSGVTVKIKGTTITPAESWTAGATYKAIAQLSTSDITAENLGDGYVFEARVDNNNHQVWLYFKQLFAPISNISEKETATSYYIKNAAGYYPYVDNGNIKATQDRKSSSKYIFIKAATVGQYYIYDISANKYVYANSTGNGGNQTSQSSSKVQMTTDLSTAKPWTFTYDGRIVPAAGGNAGLNFTGGPSYVLNLYATTDGNSEWTIIDSSIGSLACAVTMFSEPGKEYIHKLIPESGVTVESITLNGDLASSDLTLKTDRVNKGNNYKYVYGHAPTAEGTYTYDVNLSDGTKATVKLTVSSFLQSPTPGMVWVSWNWFKNTINATNLTEIADGLKSKGLYNVGFKTIVIDDAWGTGSSNATLTYNSEKFPNGMESFVSGINAKGIKVGIYSDAANSTCGNFQPGSLGVETQHVQLFDSWGIDFLKYDFCGGSNAQKSYTTMGDAIAALNATRKGTNPDPFVFNACEWGRNKPWQWGAEAGTSMWRATSDAREDWIGTHDFPGVLGGSDEVRDLWMYAGVNRFNDLDMMTIGLHGKGSPSNHTASHPSDGGTIQGLTDDQARSQMSIWSMLASPLSLSCDVRETPSNPCNSGAGVTPLTATDLATLKNADILTISQDPLGQQAEYMPSLGSNSEDFSTSGCDVYVKDMVNGQKALAIVNRSASATMEAKTISFDNIYLNAGTTYYVKNVWTGKVTQCTGTITTDAFKASETKVYIISENELEDTSEDTPDEPEDSYITVSTSTGSMNSGWTNKWTHSSAPAITISCSPANINSSNGNLDIRNGSGSNNCNFTITAPEGYHITGYSATVTGSGYTVTPAGGSAITVTNDGVALNVTGLDAQTATFKATGNNSQCVYSNFKVYYKAVEPTEPTDPTYPFIVSPSTNDLHWHYLQVNGNKYVAYDSTTGRFNNSTNAPTGENGLFAFVQVEGGFKIVNKAAGIDKAISEPIGTNIVNETLVGVVDYNQAKTYIYQNNSGHDVFGIASNDQAHLNDIGGKLGYWVSAASGTGDGSTFKFIPAEVMISTPEVKHYYTIRNNNNPSNYAHYDSDNQYLTLGTALNNSAVFYFTSAGSNANGSQLVNIHNYEAGDSKTMNDWNSWGTSSPRTWYIKLADGTTGQLNDFNIALNSNYANSWNHQNPYVKSWSAGNDRGSGWYIEEVTKKTYTIKIVGCDDNNYTIYNQGTPYHHGDQITGFFFSAENFSQDAAGNQPVKNTVTMEGEYLVFSFYEYDTVTGGTRPADINDYSLWYDEPATKTGVSDQWMEYALPMGNGQLGATIVGGVMTDQIQFNEKTLWEGGNTNSGSQGYYQNFGSILVKDLGSNFSIANASKPVSNYVRYLDIMDGVAGVNFSSSTGSNYTRRYFTAMGQDDKVFVARYDVDGSDKLNLLFSYAPDGQINASGVTYSYDNGVAEATFHGKLTTVQYNTRFRVLTDGTLSRTDNGIKVANGTYATLLMAAATDFDITTTTATSGESEQELASRVQSRVASAAGKSYDALLSAHTAKQYEYMGRVDFHVGGASTMTTDGLVDFYNVNANNKGTADGLFLEQLYFQYGRYMTVAANADTSIPAPSNLQGIWNDRSNSSFWHCDLHADINVEMNYWPADPTNLSEMHLPFLNHIIGLSTSKAWTDYAKKVSGNNSVPGWSVACESNIFGGTSQFSNGNMKTLGAWYCTHLWRYYQYTLDKEFLKKALPVMYNAALYIKSIAQQDIADRGSLYVIKGEYSPEHEGGNLITAFAQQTSSELFDEIIKAHAELGSASPLTNEQVQEISNFYDNFNKGVQIENYSFNRNNVQYTDVPCIAEWMDKPLSDPGHRHLSHLMCVYPFSQITAYGTTQQEQDLFTAAGNAILARTGDVTGWSMGWQTNVYARVLKGNEARGYLSHALRHSTSYVIAMGGEGGCYYNLFDAHSPFQIDGNYGCTSGVAEMLLQSYDGTIHLLPALPDAWANGHINGLKAIGNFQVDQKWANKQLTKATIVNKHTAAQDLYVQYGTEDLTAVKVTVNGVETAPVLVAGKGYKLAAVAPNAEVVINISGEPEEEEDVPEPSVTATYAPAVYPAQQEIVGEANLDVNVGSTKTTYTFSNDVLAAQFVKKNGTLMFNGSTAMNLKPGTELFTIKFGNGSTVVNASDMTFVGNVETGNLTANTDAVKGAEHFAGKYIQATFTHEYEGSNVTFVWKAELRDGSHYLRTDLTMTTDKDVQMNAIIPMQYDVDAAAAGSTPAVVGNTRGAVLMSDKIFAGLETPTAYNSVISDTTVPEKWSNYGAWTGASDFSWMPSELPSGITDLSSNYTPQTVVGSRGYLKFDTTGNQTITFTYTEGGHKLNIVGVDVLDTDGNIVDHDYHEGRTGDAHVQNTYTLNIPSVGYYQVRYFISLLAWSENYKSESISSKGNITYSGSVSVPTVVFDLDPVAQASTRRKVLSADHIGNNENITDTWDTSTNQFIDMNDADVPARIVELGHSANNIYSREQNLNIASAGGTLTTTFTYKGGSNRLQIVGVDLIDEQNHVAISDYHFGYTGNAAEGNTYSFIVPAAGQYKLRYLVSKQGEALTSNGDIAINYEIIDYLHLPAPAEVSIQGLWSRQATLKASTGDNLTDKDVVWNVSSVVGLVNPDHKRRSFLAYSERERAVPWRPFPIYNSWYELNINRKDNETPTDNNMSAELCTNIVEAWKEKLYDQYNVGIKSFVWDDGWDQYGTWEHHANFPNGFMEAGQAAAAMNTGIGAWLGPVGGYGSSGTYRRNYWNAENRGGMALSNIKYYEVFKNAIVRLVETEPTRDHYDFNYFKFDGISGQFSSVGPDPGAKGNEDAEGIITCERYVRENVKEDVFFNTTVGTWASPFWFHFSDAIWRQENDYGTIGNNSSSRENWITYRDRLVYQNYIQRSPICPINTLMTHGFILHQRENGNFDGVSNDLNYQSVLNELRCAFACGSGMVELYADHRLMTNINGGKLWSDLTDCLKWQEANKDVLPDAHWVGGNPWTGSKAEIYGWAAWNGEKATLTLRNGAPSQQTFTTTLRDALDIPASFTGTIQLTAAFADQLGSLATIAGIAEGSDINPDTQITFTLPASSVYVYNGIDSEIGLEEAVEAEFTLNPEEGDVEQRDLREIAITFDDEGQAPMTGEILDQEVILPTLSNGNITITAQSVGTRDEVYNVDYITFSQEDIAKLTDGTWTLTIPQGTFYVMGEYDIETDEVELIPIKAITATYNVVSGEVIATLTINGEETNYYESNDIALNDGEAGLTKVEIPNDVDDVDVTYTRSFTGDKATAWQAWYVPFKYTLTSADVNTFDFAYIWTLGVDVKTGKATNIIYEDLVEGDVLKANTPYLIKAKAAATEPYEFKATGLCATRENHIDCSTTKYKYDFVGSYESFVLGGQPYYALDNSGAFAYTSSATYKLQPYRYYMYITEKKTNSILDPHSSSNVQKLTLIHRGENDEQTTSINAINGNDSHATTVDLTGRIVSNPRAGLFISNGKKYIVK